MPPLNNTIHWNLFGHMAFSKVKNMLDDPWKSGNIKKTYNNEGGDGDMNWLRWRHNVAFSGVSASYASFREIL
jgi:hypothetical protein